MTEARASRAGCKRLGGLENQKTRPKSRLERDQRSIASQESILYIRDYLDEVN